MGMIRHHAIIVTTHSINTMHKVLDAARGIFGDDCGNVVADPLPPHGHRTNGYHTITVVPDGSKEFWPASDAGDARRARFIEFLQGLPAQGHYPDWVEVCYGETSPRVTAGYYG